MCQMIRVGFIMYYLLNEVTLFFGRSLFNVLPCFFIMVKLVLLCLDCSKFVVDMVLLQISKNNYDVNNYVSSSFTDGLF